MKLKKQIGNFKLKKNKFVFAIDERKIKFRCNVMTQINQHMHQKFFVQLYVTYSILCDCFNFTCMYDFSQLLNF